MGTPKGYFEDKFEPPYTRFYYLSELPETKNGAGVFGVGEKDGAWWVSGNYTWDMHAKDVGPFSTRGAAVIAAQTMIMLDECPASWER